MCDSCDHNDSHKASEEKAPEEAGCSCHSGEHAHEHGHDHEHGGFNWLWRIVVPGLLFGVGMVGREWLGEIGFYAVMGMAYLLCGLPVLKEAAHSVGKRDFFNEFTLMGLATLVAMGIGEMAEAVGVMLFYSLGEAVQDKAAGKSRRSIKALLASKPETARVLTDGTARETAPEAVAVGAVILVKPGEKVPLDGVVESGTASVDMSSLTGEPAPAAVGPGDKVYSGSISLDGDLTIRTTAKYSDSMVGKILAMVENAVAMKSRTERFITVFARYYTPAVVAAAVLVALVPPLALGGAWNVWIYRALVLLVVSCPCALFLSVPLAFFAGIGAASRKGMLVKGGQVFDALARARSVVFDKTGTLTRGRPVLVRTEAAPDVAASEVVRLAAVAESRSNHPLARAVVEASGAGDTLPEGVLIRDVAGKGIVANSSDGEILVGNAKLLRERGVEFGESVGADVVSYVALNGRYMGSLFFADRLKSDSAEAVGLLRGAGMKLYMLTGDRAETASAVASELGLDGFRAGLLPDEKVSAFRELSPGGEAVFVGDGVNDAPVLAASGVGVAMGALGSAAAVEAADAVILDDGMGRLPELFAIARRTRRVAGENIGFALLVKTVIMILGVMGVSGLWSAVFADVGVALLAVLNSLRLTWDR